MKKPVAQRPQGRLPARSDAPARRVSEEIARPDGRALNKDEIREILIGAARAGNALTYSQMLNLLGYSFTRPKMRALCKALDSIDQDGRVAGEPDLAVLVVRQSDGLPGQGWFVSRAHLEQDMPQPFPLDWEGAEAKVYVKARQEDAFRYWGED